MKSIEKRNRIRLLLASYSYYMLDNPIMEDREFDKLCSEINLEQSTGNKKLDNWFRKNFKSYTGQWIYDFPELDKLIKLYNRLYLK